jgi:hypothetical protein
VWKWDGWTYNVSRESVPVSHELRAEVLRKFRDMITIEGD